MDERLRWRLAKLVILSWARKENYIEPDKNELELDVSNAYKRSSIKGTLETHLIDLVGKWGLPIEKGIEWIRTGNEECLTYLTNDEKKVFGEIRLTERKKFLDECYKQQQTK